MTALFGLLLSPILINGVAITTESNFEPNSSNFIIIEVQQNGEGLSCSNVPTSSQFEVDTWGHPGKEFVRFDPYTGDDFISTAWDTNNPTYTTLVFDRVTHGEFDDNGYGFLEIQVDYDFDDGTTQEYGCSATALLWL